MTNGPKVTIKLSCFECRHAQSESYRIQGDSGSNVYCCEPRANDGARRYIGDTCWDTPDWCPLLPTIINPVSRE